MLFLQLTGFAAPQRHKGRCIGISKHALMGNNCSTQYILLNRISCYRIDGMSVFPSIFQIEITVVAGSCESQPFRQLHNLFKLGVCSSTVILRSDNANAPIPPLRVLSFRYHFAADVYHIVRYAFAVEQTRDYVTDSTAAEHREIEQDAGIVFHHTVPCKRTFRKPTKWRILSTSCGVMLSNFVKPNPHRLISGAQVTSNIPPVCSDACMAVRKGLHQVIYLTMFFVPSVSLCRIHF